MAVCKEWYQSCALIPSSAKTIKKMENQCFAPKKKKKLQRESNYFQRTPSRVRSAHPSCCAQQKVRKEKKMNERTI
jgi:hypothetical protein